MKDGMCTKCGAQQVAYLEYVPDKGQYASNRTLGATDVERKTRPGGLFAFFFEVVEGDELEVEAYVCTNCGYFEEWVKNAELIPWEQVEGLQWVHPHGPGS